MALVSKIYQFIKNSGSSSVELIQTSEKIPRPAAREAFPFFLLLAPQCGNSYLKYSLACLMGGGISGYDFLYIF